MTAPPSTHARPSRHALSAWPAALIVGAGLLAYANSFVGPFVFDDLPAITENASIRKLSAAFVPPANGSSVAGRPLVNLSFALNYAFGRYDPVGYHAFNLLIHLLAGLALYGIVRRTLASLVDRFSAHDARLVAVGAALVWTVHPLQTESVTFIVQRTESLFGLFLLATLYAFIRATEAATSRAWPVLTVVAGLAGIATKEAMVVAPVLVLLYDRTFVSGSFIAAWRQRRWLHSALFATWIPLAWLVANAGHSRPIEWTMSWRYLLTQCEGIARYLKLSFWPDPLVVDYGTSLVTSLADVFPQAVLLVLLAAAGAIAVWRKPAAGFLAAWFFAILAPSSSVVPLVTQPIAEHRMYLPLAALTTAAALGAHALLRTRGLLVIGAIAAVFIGLTLRRNQDYASAVALWNQTLQEIPDNARAHNNLGKHLSQAGRHAESFAHFQESARLNPAAPDTQANLGIYYERAGRHDLAEAHYREAIRLQRDCAAARINFAAMLVDSRRLDEALPFLEETVRLLPDLADPYNNLGVCLLELKRATEAIAPLERATQLDPENSQAHANLANALSLTERREQAVASYETALRLNPDFATAHENYGLLLLKMERPRDAAAHFEAAVRLNPNNEIAKARLEYARAQARAAVAP